MIVIFIIGLALVILTIMVMCTMANTVGKTYDSEDHEVMSAYLAVVLIFTVIVGTIIVMGGF